MTTALLIELVALVDRDDGPGLELLLEVLLGERDEDDIAHLRSDDEGRAVVGLDGDGDLEELDPLALQESFEEDVAPQPGEVDLGEDPYPAGVDAVDGPGGGGEDGLAEVHMGTTSHSVL
jgi:hypothetical protein